MLPRAMGFVIFFVFFVLVAVGLVFLGRTLTKVRDRTWAEVASQTGLTYESRTSGGNCSLSGKMGGHPVVVRSESSGGESSSTSTVYQVGFPAPLGFHLNVQRTGLFRQFIKVFGAEDIEVGDAEFDAKYVVKGWTHEDVRKFLTPARRLRCARFLSAEGERRITEHGLKVTRPGMASDVDEMVPEIRRLLAQSRNFYAPPAEETHLNAALEARAKGELDTALTEVRAVKQTDVDARVVEGEILYVSGQYEAAERAFADASRTSPSDTEARAWRERAEAKSLGVQTPAIPPELVDPALAEVAPEKGSREARKVAKLRKLAERVKAAKLKRPVPVEAWPTSPFVSPAANVAKPPAASSLLSESPEAQAENGAESSDEFACGAVCADLFGADTSGIETSRVFEERFLDQRVRWTGTLEAVMATSFDLVFGSRSMAKATLVVHEATIHGMSGLKVRAVVAFPESDVEAMRARRGESVAFSGRLIRCDPLVRNLFVDDAQWLDAVAADVGDRASERSVAPAS